MPFFEIHLFAYITEASFNFEAYEGIGETEQEAQALWDSHTRSIMK